MGPEEIKNTEKRNKRKKDVLHIEELQKTCGYYLDSILADIILRNKIAT